MLLVGIAVIGVAAAAAVSLGSVMARRDAEQHLLAIGAEFQQALRSYSGVPPGASARVEGRGPHTLEDLLKDPRTPGLRRHLRQIHMDPLTGKAEWGVVRDNHGLILGVHSLAEGTPIKRTGFEARWATFEEAASYRDWVFGLPQEMPFRKQ